MATPNVNLIKSKLCIRISVFFFSSSRVIRNVTKWNINNRHQRWSGEDNDNSIKNKNYWLAFCEISHDEMALVSRPSQLSRDSIRMVYSAIEWTTPPPPKQSFALVFGEKIAQIKHDIYKAFYAELFIGWWTWTVGRDRTKVIYLNLVLVRSFIRSFLFFFFPLFHLFDFWWVARFKRTCREFATRCLFWIRNGMECDGCLCVHVRAKKKVFFCWAQGLSKSRRIQRGSVSVCVYVCVRESSCIA